VISAGRASAPERRAEAPMRWWTACRGATWSCATDGFFPYESQRIKDLFEELKADYSPDVVFMHQRTELHEDHRLSAS
jgi:hypothetical protein